MGDADFNHLTQKRNQLAVAADSFLREQNLSPVLQSTLSYDMEEQLKLVHKVIDVVDCPNRRTFVTLLRYKADNPVNSYAQQGKFTLGHGRSVQTGHRHLTTTFDDLTLEGSVEDLIVLDEEEDKENAPPTSTAVSVRPAEPPRPQRSRDFGVRI